MDRAFTQELMEKTGFPAEARQAFTQAEEQLLSAGQEEALDGAVEFYYENDLSTKLVEPLLEEIAQASGVHLYTVWELFLIQAAKPAREGYLEKGVPEDIVWDTWEDLKYKAIECKNVQGVWGNFVAHWYPIFFSNDIVKLGRLEYENVTYEGEVPYEKNGYVVRPGDKVKSVHIPSSGEPFDQAARLASYKKAYQFFKEELQGGPLVCVCGSWLLYPPYSTTPGGCSARPASCPRSSGPRTPPCGGPIKSGFWRATRRAPALGCCCSTGKKSSTSEAAMETELDLDLLRVFEKEPGSLELYLTLEQRLREMLPAMRRKVGKTEAAFYLRHWFGSASLLAVRRKAQRPSPYLTVSFGLSYPLDSPRVDAKTEPYPNRWTHHVMIGSAEEIDQELLGWLWEAAQFAASKPRKAAGE